jgi:hypothetical protein
MYRINKEHVPEYCCDPFQDGCRKEAKYRVEGKPFCKDCAEDCFLLDDSPKSDNLGCWMFVVIVGGLLTGFLLEMCNV